MANIKHVNSVVDREFRNRINEIIDLINAQGKSIQSLVAEGQLTPEEYSQLLKEINGLISKGNVKLDDLDPEVLKMFGEVKPEFNLLSIPRVGSVDENKTTFIKTPLNLVDESKLLRKHSISGADEGVPKPNSTNHVTDFISVVPGEYITASTQGGSHRIVFYGLNKEYIDNSYIRSDPATFKVPDNVYKIRLNVHITQEGNAQVNRGKTLLPYSKYEKPKLDGVEIGNLPENSVTSSAIGKNQVNIEHTNFIKTSSNLIDLRKVTPNCALTATSNGAIVSSPNYSVTDYISVISNDSYTFKTAHQHRISYYDSNKKWISDSYVPKDVLTITIPDNVSFIRTNIHADYQEPQINKGDELLRYEPYYKKLDDDITINNDDDEKDDEIHNDLKIVETELRYSSPLKEDASVDSENYLLKYELEDFYDLYDNLVKRFPDYVSMEILGLDDDGKEIRRYDFKPAEVTKLENNTPQILITTGTHGYERVPILAAYQMFEQICKDWQENLILEKLRWNVHFVIIPVVNPYSLSNNQRKTRNGVDVLRNYPVSWDSGSKNPDSSSYRGVEPLSEVEAKYVYDVFESEDNWIHVTDYHNFFTSQNENTLLWIGATDEKTTKLSQNLLRNITGQLKKEYDWIPNDNNILGYSSMNRTGIYWYAQSKGISGSLFESVQTITREPNATSYSQSAMKLGVDSFTYWLYLMYLNYK